MSVTTRRKVVVSAVVGFIVGTRTQVAIDVETDASSIAIGIAVPRFPGLGLRGLSPDDARLLRDALDDAAMAVDGRDI